MSSLHTETRGRFRWLETVECDADLTIPPHAPSRRGRCRTVDGADVPIVFVTDLAGGEVTLTVQQAAELVAALCELPDPMPGYGRMPTTASG